MAYIIAVNTGGTCPCDVSPKELCDSIPEFAACKEEVRRDLITATAAIAGMSSIVFGALTNLPVALAPGMGLNAYFAFQSASTAVDLFLTALPSLPYSSRASSSSPSPFTGLRQWLVRLIPATIKTATGVGIGLFLTEIGLSYSVGIGAITGGGRATPVALGGCPREVIDLRSGMCASGHMKSPKMWVGIFCGGIVTSFLMAFRVKYAFVIGIALGQLESRNTAISYFPATDEGNARFDFFQQVIAWHPMRRMTNQLDWAFSAGSSHFALTLFTFLYVDIIDATATLYSMVRFCGVNRDDGDFPRSTIAYCTDAAFISIGALLGTSPVTVFVESGAGIAEGGRMGLTDIVAGLCFIASVFFALIFASIPPWATGCTLILVGCMMVRQVTQINWNYIGDMLPSFVVIVFIPFSYGFSYGLIAGLFVYATLNGLVGLIATLSRGRIEPQEYELKEYWTWKGVGRPPWFVRAIRARQWKSSKRANEQSLETDGGRIRSPEDAKLESTQAYNVMNEESGPSVVTASSVSHDADH